MDGNAQKARSPTDHDEFLAYLDPIDGEEDFTDDANEDARSILDITKSFINGIFDGNQSTIKIAYSKQIPEKGKLLEITTFFISGNGASPFTTHKKIDEVSKIGTDLYLVATGYTEKLQYYFIEVQLPEDDPYET